MRASTIFFLIIAILLGLTGIVVARAMGWFERRPDQPPPVAKAPETRQVLVADTNIYKGQTIKFTFVKVKAISQEEYEKEQRLGRNLLPGNVNAINRCIAARNIHAETILREEDIIRPEGGRSIETLLIPGARAVQVSVRMNHSAGCAFGLGDYVDVMLTTVVGDAVSEGQPITRSAIIARNLKVLGKQGSLYPISKTLAVDKCPCIYLLEANPYRAGLIEYSKEKGIISLLPASSPEQQLLDTRRDEWRTTYEGLLKQGKNPGPFVVLDVPSINQSEEFFKTEFPRVQAYYDNLLTITDKELARIFKLQEMKYVPPTVVTHILGNRIAGQQNFGGGSGPQQGVPEFGTFQPADGSRRSPGGGGRPPANGGLFGLHSPVSHGNHGVEAITATALVFAMPASGCAPQMVASANGVMKKKG